MENTGNKPRIIFGEGDFPQPTLEQSKPPDLTKSIPHPLDDPEFRAFVQREFPERAERIAEMAKPTVSNNPNELESWEARHILQRKQRLEFEGDFDYLIRLLYEEMFSVNQTAFGEQLSFFKG